MASSKTTPSIALFLCLNFLFFCFFTSCVTCSHPIARRYGGSPGSGKSPSFGGKPSYGGSPGSGGAPGSGSPGTGGGPGSGGNPGPGGNPGTGGNGTCPRDALKIAVCARVLTLVNVTIGTPPVTPCCSLIQGLVDLEAAICLCTAIRASILGLNINLPINLSLLLNICSRNSPRGFQCP